MPVERWESNVLPRHYGFQDYAKAYVNRDLGVKERLKSSTDSGEFQITFKLLCSVQTKHPMFTSGRKRNGGQH